MSERSFWAHAASDPDRVAVIEDGGSVTTYGELAVAANRIANGLRERGLTVGDTVAALLSNRVEFIALQLATHQIGMVLSPLNRHLTGPEAGYVLADSGAAVVVADETSAAAATEAADLAGIADDARYAIGDLPGFRDFADLFGGAERPEDRTSGGLLMYSSGTTGRPKGIRVPRSGLPPEAEQVANGSRMAGLGARPDGVYLGTSPLYHSAPNSHATGPLSLGQTVVLSSGFDPEHVLELIGIHQVTDIFMVPTMMHRLLSLPADIRARYDVSSLRLIVHSAAICPVETKRGMIDWFGPILLEYYGSSETSSVAMIDSTTWLEHPGSVGKAIPGAEIRVCDETGAAVPRGTPGLLHLKVAKTFEYNGDEAKTTSSHQDGFFIPGDIGYLDEDGYLFLCDRRTDMIISGGVNIYPAEIESELLGNEAVLDAAVFGASDPEWGQRVVGLVQLRDGVIDDGTIVESILARCRTRLAKFKIPRSLEVVEQLPRTPTGKLNRARLRESWENDSSVAVANGDR